jgi:hypothetical protein
MRFRKLRIAWSVGWGIACVLLISLWVVKDTSFSRPLYTVPGTGGRLFVMGYYCVLELYIGGDPSIAAPLAAAQSLRKIAVLRQRKDGQPLNQALGFACDSSKIAAPLWFLYEFCGIAMFVPWIRWRFTLRTLLVATTLVAVVLGLAVYSAGK